MDLAVLVLTAATFLLAVVGVGVVVYTQIRGTRSSREMQGTVMELLVMMEQTGRISRDIIAGVATKVGVDPAATDPERAVAEIEEDHRQAV